MFLWLLLSYSWARQLSPKIGGQHLGFGIYYFPAVESFLMWGCTESKLTVKVTVAAYPGVAGGWSRLVPCCTGGARLWGPPTAPLCCLWPTRFWGSRPDCGLQATRLPCSPWPLEQTLYGSQAFPHQHRPSGCPQVCLRLVRSSP